MYQLSEEETNIIYERLQGEGLKSAKLEQDLFDHFYCHVEAQMGQGTSFENAYRKAVKDIYPNGAKEIEFELFFIINFNKQLSMRRFIFIAAFFTLLLLIVGFVFKLMHWPYTGMLLFSGFAVLLLTVIITMIYVPLYMRYKSRGYRLRAIAGLLSVGLLSAGFFFKVFHYYGANIIFGLGVLSLVLFFLPLFFHHLYKHGFSKTTVNEKA